MGYAVALGSMVVNLKVTPSISTVSLLIQWKSFEFQRGKEDNLHSPVDFLEI